MSTIRARAGSFDERLRVPANLDVPHSHLGLKWSGLEPEHSHDVLELFRRCQQFTDDDSIVNERRVARYLTKGLETDDRHDSIGGWDAQGVLRAYGMATALSGCETILQAQLRAVIDPAWRGRGIGRALLDWQDGRARQLLADEGRDLPVSIETRVDPHNTEQRRLVTAAGFTPVRTIEEFASTVEPIEHVNAVIDATVESNGLRIINFDHDLTNHIRSVYNRTSAVERGGRIMSETDFSRRVRDVDPQLSYVAVTDEESPLVVGFLLAGARYGGGGAWIEFIGVERAWRNKGVTNALMAYHLDAVVDAGFELSSTEIDTKRGQELAAWFNDWDFYSRASDIVYAIEV